VSADLAPWVEGVERAVSGRFAIFLKTAVLQIMMMITATQWNSERLMAKKYVFRLETL
jgi:hypothetical protein